MQKTDIVKNFLPFTAYPYAGEHRPCSVCGSHESQTLSRYDRRLKHLHTLVCGHCGLIRTDPMPTDAEISRYYAHEYRFDYQLAGSAPSRAHVTRRTQEAEERMVLLAPVLQPGAELLDVGCGSGEFLACLARTGCRGIGIDPGAAYAEYARDSLGLDITVTDLENAGFSPERFDVLTAHHVVEHLPDPVGILRRMRDLIRPDGVVYISVPDMTPGDRPAFLRLHFAHVHGFTPPTLKLAAWEAGLIQDSRFTQSGCTMVFRRATEGDAPVRPDPAHAANLVAQQPANDIAGHYLRLGFLRDAGIKLAKYFRAQRDGFRSGKGGDTSGGKGQGTP